MSKLRPIPAREVIRKLRALGYEGPFGGGKHLVMRHPVTGQKIRVPFHGGKDLPIGTLRAIIRAAGVDVKTWERL
ncbi:MAG: type II toxin-antitoxin system HicA family toxin [Armatimonadota bacterium]|nr:type II toxin-antitoxin system HicA family toxin [Armatimonadota bacterium]